MKFIEKSYRYLCHFYMALAATSLLPAIYFIKIGASICHTQNDIVNICLDLLVILGITVIMSLLALLWMKKQGEDSIKTGVSGIAPVCHEYLPVYLGYIFVSLSLPVLMNGKIDWQTLIIVYVLICFFVTFSKTLCFNPLFIIFGYGYYQVTTKNGVKVFVITKRKIKKGEDNLIFEHLHKVNELVFIDTDND